MAKIQDIDIPHLEFAEAAAPGTPASGIVRLYAKTDGLLYSKDDAGAESAVGGGIADQGSITYLDATEAAAPATPASGKVRIYAKSDGRIYSKDDAGVESGPFSSGGAAGSGYVADISGHADLLQYWPLNEPDNSTSYADTEAGTALTHLGTAPGNGGPPQNRDWDNGGSVIIPDNTRRIGRTAITWPAAWTIEIIAFIGAATTNSALVGQWSTNGAMIFVASGTEIRIYSNGNFDAWTSTLNEVLGLHHIAMTHNGTTHKLYWDGVEKISAARTPPSGTNGGSFLVGAYNSASLAPGTAAAYSDIAIYDAALSVGDILAHSNLVHGL